MAWTSNLTKVTKPSYNLIQQLYDLDKDLGLTDQQYLLSLTIFFISYSVFEVPSNILLKRLQPRIWLSLMMLIWGLVMVGTSPLDRAFLSCDVPYSSPKPLSATSLNSWVLRSYRYCHSTSLNPTSTAVRWLLGMFEAGLFPGVSYYLSWYGILAFIRPGVDPEPFP